jgi:hypothetical protein
MDFNLLLDTSKPFDATKLSLLEKVVEALYATTTSQNDVSKTKIINNNKNYII